MKSGTLHVGPTMRQRQQQPWLGQPFIGINYEGHHGDHDLSASRRAGNWAKLRTISFLLLSLLLVSVLLWVTSPPPVGHAVGSFAAHFVGSRNRAFVKDEGFIYTKKEVEISVTNEVLDTMEPSADMEPAEVNGRSRARQMSSVLPDEGQTGDAKEAHVVTDELQTGEANGALAVPDQSQTGEVKEARVIPDEKQMEEVKEAPVIPDEPPQTEEAKDALVMPDGPQMEEAKDGHVVPDELQTEEAKGVHVKADEPQTGEAKGAHAMADELQTGDAEGAHPMCANGMIPGTKESNLSEKEKGMVGNLESAEAADDAGKQVEKRKRRGRKARMLLQERRRTTGRERVLMGEGESKLPELTWAGLRDLSESECDAGLFYIYDLPEKFNIDFVRNCETYHPDFCWKVEQQGLGPSLLPEDPACEKIPGTYSHLLGDLSSWYRTHQHSLESTYHARLMQHPCRTKNPEEALIFYMPYYAGLAFDTVFNQSDSVAVNELPNQFLAWLGKQSYFQRKGGFDHFLVLGRGAFNFRFSEELPWGTTLLNSPLLENVTTLTFDRDLWDVTMTSIPYPTFFHPSTDDQLRAWQERVRNMPRRWRASFVGSKERYLGAFSFSAESFGFRSLLMDECEAWENCAVLDCKDLGVGERSPCVDPAPPMELYLSSDFCLQPRGDTPPRKGIFDSMVAGCIPVFFHNDTAYNQYHWYLPLEIERYSVFIDMDAPRNGSTSMVEVLSRFSQSEIEEMRRVVIDEIIPSIITFNPASPGPRKTKDAVSRAVDGMMVRMGRSNEGLKCDFPSPWMRENKGPLAYSRMRLLKPGEVPLVW